MERPVPRYGRTPTPRLGEDALGHFETPNRNVINITSFWTFVFRSPSPEGVPALSALANTERKGTEMNETTWVTEFMTTKQVSEFLGVPEGTLRYYRLTGTGPASFKLGGRRVVYRRSEVDRWVAEQEASSSRGGGR